MHRLKITKGHLEKVIKMVDDDTYCIDVLHQIQAIEKALKETEGVMLENHLKCCVADAIRNGKQEHAIEEVMQVFNKTK